MTDIVIDHATVDIVTVQTGIQGPPGPGADKIIRSAGMNLGGHRMVSPDSSGNLIYSDHTDVSQASRVMGMTTGAASSGADVTVLAAGLIQFTGWSFDMASHIFLGVNGTVTQTPPLNGFLLVVGHPVDTDTMMLRVLAPILL